MDGGHGPSVPSCYSRVYLRSYIWGLDLPVTDDDPRHGPGCRDGRDAAPVRPGEPAVGYAAAAGGARGGVRRWGGVGVRPGGRGELSVRPLRLLEWPIPQRTVLPPVGFPS